MIVQPTISSYLSFMLSKMIKKGFKVSISGIGSDEIFRVIMSIVIESLDFYNSKKKYKVFYNNWKKNSAVYQKSIFKRNEKLLNNNDFFYIE